MWVPAFFLIVQINHNHRESNKSFAGVIVQINHNHHCQFNDKWISWDEPLFMFVSCIFSHLVHNLWHPLSLALHVIWQYVPNFIHSTGSGLFCVNSAIPSILFVRKVCNFYNKLFDKHIFSRYQTSTIQSNDFGCLISQHLALACRGMGSRFYPSTQHL